MTVVDATWTLNHQRLLQAASPRNGILRPPEIVQPSHADIPGLWHAAVPPSARDRVASVSGGAGRTAREAIVAAIGEGLERYAAIWATLEMRARGAIDRTQRIDANAFSLFSRQQRRHPAFPAVALYTEACAYVTVTESATAEQRWVPASLVLLRDASGEAVATSNGLAAGRSPAMATLRAVQELIERDALVSTWLHSVPAREVALDPRHTADYAARGGAARAFDITPAYSTHPVALVAGTLPLSGRPRHAIGAACRATWEDAVEKAWLECAQGLVFAGWITEQPDREQVSQATDVRTFDEHAAYYTWNPHLWDALPLFRGEPSAKPKPAPVTSSIREQAQRLLAHLDTAGVHILTRDLTTPDLRQLGVSVIRALSPQLTPLHCHEGFPHLGGTTPDVRWRYPWVKPQRLQYPSPFPHPLG